MVKINFKQEMKCNDTLFYFIQNVFANESFYTTHISMYLALYQFWRLNKYQNAFRIRREDVMKLSKIKSFATYHKCINDLKNAGFIAYSPSYDSFKGSFMKIIDIQNINLENKNLNKKSNLLNIQMGQFFTPGFDEVDLYFKERNFISEDAIQFYSYYQKLNWKLHNNKQMKCWRSAARSWIYKLNKKDNTEN